MQRTGQPLRPLRLKRKAPVECSFDGCGRVAIGHGLCQAHGLQRRQGVELRPIQKRNLYRSSLERDANGNKECRRCREWLPVSNFTVDPSKTDGFVQWCRPCSALHKIEWRYGLRFGQIDELLAAQSGACAICRKPFDHVRRYYIDHDHQCCPGKKSCGKCVRGLLCNRCNIVAGHLDQNDGLEPFFAYIARLRTS